jgi:hypothetical protein
MNGHRQTGPTGPFRATSGLIDNANKTVFQLTIQKRARRIFAAQVERSTCVTYSRYNLPFYRHF